jgi:hypothetical protein
MGGETSHDGIDSRADTRIERPGVLLGTDDSRAHSFHRLASTLWELSVVRAAATQSILERAVTIIQMGTSLISTVVHALRP